MGKFVISKTKNGEYTFNLLASNGQVVLSASETYKTLDAAKNGCASVAKNAGAHVEDQTKEGFEKLTHPKYELYKDKAGEFRWRLKARNGENIGRSEGYKAKSSALNGVESVGKNGPDAPDIVEEE